MAQPSVVPLRDVVIVSSSSPVSGPSRSLPVVGLVGGVGAGKSSVARALGGTLSVLVLNADQSGHRALLDPAIRERLIARFGAGILSSAGEIDRKALAPLVFGDGDEQRTRRRDLEGIVQPWIRRDLLEQLDAARKTGGFDVVLLDAPVLLETGWNALCDAVAFIDTPWQTRLERVGSRGWSADELGRREASQMPLEEKRRRSDVILDNSGAVEVAAGQLREFLRGKFGVL